MTQHEIRTLADDELITEPGFYNISLDRHHNQPCDGVSVTSGVLRTMETRTPADVWAFHKLNPDRFEKAETKALKLGRAMAAHIEGGEEQLRNEYFVLSDDDPLKPTALMSQTYEEHGLQDFDRSFKLLPKDKPRKPLSSDIRKLKAGETLTPEKMKACEFWDKIEKSSAKWFEQKEFDRLSDIRTRVEFWQAYDEDPRDKITAKEFSVLSAMAKALAEDPGASAVMGGLPEITMAVQDDATGLWLLARPDTVNFDGTVTDFKKMNTMGKAFTPWLVDERITAHAYDMQMAFAADVYQRLTGDWPEQAGIIAQVDQPPYHVIIRPIGQEDLSIGMFRNHRAIRHFAECLNSGYWPGPGEDIGEYQRPKGQFERLVDEMATEGVPL